LGYTYDEDAKKKRKMAEWAVLLKQTDANLRSETENLISRISRYLLATQRLLTLDIRNLFQQPQRRGLSASHSHSHRLKLPQRRPANTAMPSAFQTVKALVLAQCGAET